MHSGALTCENVKLIAQVITYLTVSSLYVLFRAHFHWYSLSTPTIEYLYLLVFCLCTFDGETLSYGKLEHEASVKLYDFSRRENVHTCIALSHGRLSVRLADMCVWQTHV